jgi:hypothetical protein
MRFWLGAFWVVAACHSSSHHASDAAGGGAVDAASDATADVWTSGYMPHESHALGLNDVSMLFELPEDWIAGTTVARMTGVPGYTGELVPRDAFAHLVTTPGDVGFAYERFHLVAMRFDVCDRTQPGPCPLGVDGQLRLVFQPMTDNPTKAVDVALHAFYPVPAADIGPVVDELRALARLRGFQTASPLAVDDAVTSTSPPTSYRTRLRALIAKYAVADHLTRLTMFAQQQNQPAFTWVFRGIEISGGAITDLTIPTLSATHQDVAVADEQPPGYTVMPLSNTPSGFSLLVDGPMYSAATYAQRYTALATLGPAQNPTLASFVTQQCVDCHITSFLTQQRTHLENIDPSTLPYTYKSSHDLSIAFGDAASAQGSLRAFGWSYNRPEISQRVANESAQVLDEIDQRYPAAQTTTFLDAGVVDSAPTFKRVFVASTQHDANFGGLAGADAFCTTAAAHLGGGPWLAWLSSSTVNAIDRLADVGPWYLVDGTLVFANKAAIAQGPAAAIDLDEHGAQPADSDNVWTGTMGGGSASVYTCADWTSNSMNAAGDTGLRVNTDTGWTDYGNLLCSNALPRLYCFEQ